MIEQEQWEAQVRQSPAYTHAVALLAEIELIERKLAALNRSPALKTDAGQLARLDRMAAKLGSFQKTDNKAR